MGYNTVAVLYNDYTDEFRRSGRLGERIAAAMTHGWLDRDRDRCATYFGAGVVVSQDHADGEQVVVVGRNTGSRADDATELGWHALDQMQRCLERHGYKVTKPRRKKVA